MNQSKEKRLFAIWREIFNKEDIGVHDQFFQLGGDSMLLEELMARMEEEFGVQVPYDAFFASPDIGFLVRYLTQAEESILKTKPAVQREHLVALKETGSKPPLFCVHTGNGHASTYHALARFMEEDRPVYAFRFLRRAYHGTHPLNFEALAKTYVDELLLHFPQGPYHLCGTCYGGVLAFEIARQLKEQKKTVGLLALFDALQRKDRKSGEGIRRIWKRSLWEIRDSKKRFLLPLLWRKFTSLVFLLVRKRVGALYRWSSQKHLTWVEPWYPVTVYLTHAINHYQPKYYAGRMIYYSTIHPDGLATRHQDYWREQAQEMEVVFLSCYHSEINYDEHSQWLVQDLLKHIKD